MIEPKKPFEENQRFEMWRGAKRYECVILDSFYQFKSNFTHDNRREGWRLLICYDVVDGVKKTTEKYFDELRKI